MTKDWDNPRPPEDRQTIPPEVFADPRTVIDFKNNRVIAGDGRVWENVRLFKATEH